MKGLEEDERQVIYAIKSESGVIWYIFFATELDGYQEMENVIARSVETFKIKE